MRPEGSRGFRLQSHQHSGKDRRQKCANKPGSYAGFPLVRFAPQLSSEVSKFSPNISQPRVDRSQALVHLFHNPFKARDSLFQKPSQFSTFIGRDPS